MTDLQIGIQVFITLIGPFMLLLAILANRRNR